MKTLRNLATVGILLATVACTQDEGATPVVPNGTTPGNVETGDQSPSDTPWNTDSNTNTEPASDGGAVNSTADPTYPPMPVACDSAPFSVRGSFIAGVRTLQVEGRPVEVWYPADPGAEAGRFLDSYDMRKWLPSASAEKIPDSAAPMHVTDAYRDIPASAKGPFPVLVFSHGLASYRLQSSFLMTHLASWGFVVAATEHPERGLAALLDGGMPNDDAVAQLQSTISHLNYQNNTQGQLLFGLLDMNRLGAFGHSAGGAAVGVLAENNTVQAWATLASAGFNAAPGKEALIMGGTTDQFATPTLVKQSFSGYDSGSADKRYISIAGAGHLAFTDLCVIGADQGGVINIAMDYGLEVPDIVVELANDGCRPTDLPVQEAWTIINHYVTAHFVDTLGVDTPDKGLNSASTMCFGDRIGDHEFFKPTNSEAVVPPNTGNTGDTGDTGDKGDTEQNQDNGGSDAIPGNIIEIAKAAGQFNTLLTAVEAAGLTDGLDGPGVYTVFAPTDTAFEALGEETINALLADTETLENILLYHVVEGMLYSNIVTGLTSLTMANEDDVEISVEGDTAYVNESAIIQVDINASNGVIHVLDTVLLPPSNEEIEGEETTGEGNENADLDLVDPEAGIVQCASEICDLATSVCCIGLAGQSCAAECGFLQASQFCDGPEDCEAGQMCCVGFPAGASCQDSCPGGQETLCHDSGDCPSGMACEACSFPGSPPTNVCKANGC